jgi:hypothetical protein
MKYAPNLSTNIIFNPRCLLALRYSLFNTILLEEIYVIEAIEAISNLTSEVDTNKLVVESGGRWW